MSAGDALIARWSRIEADYERRLRVTGREIADAKDLLFEWASDPIKQRGMLQARTRAFLAISPADRKKDDRLIAAATDMHEALEGLCSFAWSAVEADCPESREYLSALIGLARAALAKVSAATP